MGATLFALRSNWNSLPPVWVRGAILETPKQYLAIWTSKKPGCFSGTSASGPAARSSILVHGLQPSFRWQELKVPKPENGKPKPFFLRSWKELVAAIFEGAQKHDHLSPMPSKKHVLLLGQMQGVLKFPWLMVDEQEVGVVLCVSPHLEGLGKLYLGIFQLDAPRPHHCEWPRKVWGIMDFCSRPKCSRSDSWNNMLKGKKIGKEMFVWVSDGVWMLFRLTFNYFPWLKGALMYHWRVHFPTGIVEDVNPLDLSDISSNHP